MIKKIGKYILILVMIFMLIPKVNAEIVPVTKESLDQALKEFIDFVNEGNENEKINYSSYEVTDDSIILKNSEEILTLNYEVQENKVKLNLDKTFTNGMDFETYEKESGELSSNLVGYILVAHIQGVNFDDAMIYYALSYLYNIDTLSEITPPFVITEMEDDEEESSSTLEINGVEVPMITKEEFKNNSLKYIEQIYHNEQVINDNKEGLLNTYEQRIFKKFETDTEVVVESQLIMDLTSDYSSLSRVNQELENKITDALENMFGKDEDNTSTEQTSNIETAPKKVANKNEIDNPKTGFYLPIIVILIGTMLVILIKIITKKNKLYNIK